MRDDKRYKEVQKKLIDKLQDESINQSQAAFLMDASESSLSRFLNTSRTSENNFLKFEKFVSTSTEEDEFEEKLKIEKANISAITNAVIDFYSDSEVKPLTLTKRSEEIEKLRVSFEELYHKVKNDKANCKQNLEAKTTKIAEHIRTNLKLEQSSSVLSKKYNSLYEEHSKLKLVHQSKVTGVRKLEAEVKLYKEEVKSYKKTWFGLFKKIK